MALVSHLCRELLDRVDVQFVGVASTVVARRAVVTVL